MRRDWQTVSGQVSVHKSPMGNVFVTNSVHVGEERPAHFLRPADDGMIDVVRVTEGINEYGNASYHPNRDEEN